MKLQSQINVIPFIDIMLVLLAVVLTTATFVSEGRIPVNLPEASAAEAPGSRPALELLVDAKGNLFFEGQAVAYDELTLQLDAFQNRNPAIRLRVDEAAEFRHFVRLIDLLKARSLEDVAIVTRKVEG